MSDELLRCFSSGGVSGPTLPFPRRSRVSRRDTGDSAREDQRDPAAGWGSKQSEHKQILRFIQQQKQDDFQLGIAVIRKTSEMNNTSDFPHFKMLGFLKFSLLQLCSVQLGYRLLCIFTTCMPVPLMRCHADRMLIPNNNI